MFKFCFRLNHAPSPCTYTQQQTTFVEDLALGSQNRTVFRVRMFKEPIKIKLGCLVGANAI